MLHNFYLALHTFYLAAKYIHKRGDDTVITYTYYLGRYDSIILRSPF
jgi:hypothetical protein